MLVVVIWALNFRDRLPAISQWFIDFGQVVNTHVPLSLCSIIWYGR